MMHPFNRKSLGIGIRLTCLVCAAMILMLSCVGCASYVSMDEYSKMEDMMEDLMTETFEAKEEIEALQNSYNALQQELDLLESRYETVRSELDLLKNSYVVLQEQIEILAGSNETLKQEMESVDGLYEAVLDEIDLIKGRYESVLSELDSIKGNYDAALTEMEQLKQRILELECGVTTKIRIYIDQGHNPTSYHNAGASGNGLYEQDVTFHIGCLLADLLELDGRFEVCLSRPTADTVLGTDNNSSLDARVLGAQVFGADYFISLHTNSFYSESANGIEVFAAEQDSISYAFGTSLLQSMVDATNLRNRGMKLNPDLRVLKNATMPAVLLEMGFISNPTDAALLSQSPEVFAQGIYDGILAYFGLSQ